MPDNTLIYANKNIVYVNTAIDSNAIVFLSNASYFGQTVTIKDSAGKAGPTNIIRITTCNDVSYLDPTLSNLTIQQPFGYLTFTASSEKKWSLANTFAFDTMFTSATINTPNLNTILYKDIFSNGSISIMSVDNGNLLLNGCNTQNDEPVEITVTDPFIANTIRTSNVTISTSNTSNTLYVAAGYNTAYNVRVSYDTLNWSSPTLKFDNGFTNKLLYINGVLIALGGVQELVENTYNHYWEIRTSFNNNDWITRKKELFNSNSPLPILNNISLDIKYNNQYYFLFAGNNLNLSLYYSTNLIDWTRSVYINDEINSSKIFEINNNNQVITGYLNLLYKIDITKGLNINNMYTLSNYDYGSNPVYINKLKSFNSENSYILAGYILSNSIEHKIISIINNNSFDYSARNISLTQKIANNEFIMNNTFRVNDIYINQNTPNEVGLPSIVYVGSTNTNNSICIYYTFNNIEENQSISSLSSGNSASNIYSIYYYNKKLFLASDGVPENLIILDSNVFNEAAQPVIINNGLTTTYSYEFLDNYSPINNNLLNISNKMTTNFLSLSNIGILNTTNQTISSSNNILYRNNYPINPVGAHIEFRDSSSNFSTYPLYIGSLSNFNSGWWDKSSDKNVSAFIVESGYKLDVYSEPNYTLPLICSVLNTTSNPIYSNVYNLATPYSNASYNLTSL